MIERIAEPELMDDPQHARAYHEADFSEPHNAFVEHFKERFKDFSRGDVLDLGCGTCDVVIRFAKVFPDTHITGIDGSEAMLDIANRELKRHGISDRITIIKAYLPDDIPKKRYDAVISNSLLHHLKDPCILWRCIKDCAKDTAPIFIVDLLRPDSFEDAEALVKRYASEESPILQRDFFYSLLASYKVEEIKCQLKDNGLDYLNVEVISDRHVAIWGMFKP
ncbi:MAG: class I SAM-dependent methyltransferase [Thermodesulfovibrionia bacterium]